MLSPAEAVSLQHQTRYARLRRIVEEHDVRPAPMFADYVIPAHLMPRSFPLDTPVLRIVFPETTFFQTGRSEIEPSAQPIIVAMAKMLDGDAPDVAVFIAGHADSRGGEAYNHNLSVERARAVANALRAAGADAPDIWSVGFGESLPLYPNDTPEEMSYNRRVEFLLSSRLEAAASWLTNQVSVACSGSGSSGKLKCLSNVKVREAYIAEPVQRIIRPSVNAKIAPAPPVSQHLVKPDQAPLMVKPTPDRRIVLRLAERTYVVQRPEH